MANRRNRKKPSERRGLSNGRPPTEPERSEENNPFHREFDPKLSFRYPNLRMRLVSIPCPSCDSLVYVLAENHDNPQDVRIVNHKTVSGEGCEASESMIPLPVPEEGSGVAYVASGTMKPSIDPATVEHYIPAPPNSRSSSDGMFDYALTCPISDLVKIHSELDMMSEKSYNISQIFCANDVSEDPFYAHVDTLRDQVEEALKLRFSAGIARALHVEGDRLSFQDPVTLEYVLIPFEAIRVSQLLRSTMIRPRGMEEDEESNDPGGEQQS